MSTELEEKWEHHYHKGREGTEEDGGSEGKGWGEQTSRSRKWESGHKEVGSQRHWHKDRRFCIFIANTIEKEGLSIEVRRHLYENT